MGNSGIGFQEASSIAQSVLTKSKPMGFGTFEHTVSLHSISFKGEPIEMNAEFYENQGFVRAKSISATIGKNKPKGFRKIACTEELVVSNLPRPEKTAL